ncbi:Alkaline-phosphatase-like, core domain [Phytophthora cactorum]|nr:Alkaline-phosphatase-like, core domain [Phytophthora cactorum]
MPQLFTQKGYETWFTTGSSIGLDGWDIFLPSHGFDTVWDNHKMVELAEGYLGITHDDWYGEAHADWLGRPRRPELQILGDLLVNKTKEQKQRVSRGEARSHSSAHTTPSPVTHRTTLCQSGMQNSKSRLFGLLQGTTSRRYDPEVPGSEVLQRHGAGQVHGPHGERGVLNDTIVIITGDHGQAPEADVTNTHEVSNTRVAAAIVAEGRLGGAVGLVIEDANGVGRSLKRKVPFGERVVFSNEPNRKMAIVRGHQRLRYNQVGDSVMLHDTTSDHAMNIDLFPSLAAEVQAEWQSWRDNGRRLADYYTKRWDENCLLAVSCKTDN